MTKQNLPDHYRYIDRYDESGVFIELERFTAFKETKCCYWIIPEQYKNFVGRDDEYAVSMINKHKRRASMTSERRFAYPDKKEALYSFIKRKKWQIWHAKKAHETAESTLKLAKALHEAGETPEIPVWAGKPEFIDQMVFE